MGYTIHRLGVFDPLWLNQMVIQRKVGSLMIRAEYGLVDGTDIWAWIVQVCTQDGWATLKIGAAMTAAGACADMMSWVDRRFPPT